MRMASHILSGITVCMLVYLTAAYSQQPSDAIYWCNISRAQISGERDNALAQLETMKLNTATLNARIKELEAKAKEVPQ